MRILLCLFVSALISIPGNVQSDTSFRIGKNRYLSANREYALVVDPGDGLGEDWKPVLTYYSRDYGRLWTKSPEQFEDFHFPLHASVSNNGQFLVFGGASASNKSFDEDFHEGIRIYRADGSLVIFISRRNLPYGYSGWSTSDWYDWERTRIVGENLEFFTPGKDVPIVIELKTGIILSGEIIEGQGEEGERYYLSPEEVKEHFKKWREK